MKLHPYLCKSQEVVAHGIRSYILWDIREHPLTAQLVQQLPSRLSSEVLNSYATDPPVTSLNVTCEYPKFWSTTVYASAAPSLPSITSTTSYPFPNASHPRAVGITIADLLTAIYNHLHSQSADLNKLHPKQRMRLLEAYDKRKKMAQGAEQQSVRAGSAPHYAHNSQRQTTLTGASSSSGSGASITCGGAQEGVKLVDTFLLHTLFAGLEVDPENPYTVNLSVKRPT